jgi:hypothetical protein
VLRDAVPRAWIDRLVLRLDLNFIYFVLQISDVVQARCGKKIIEGQAISGKDVVPLFLRLDRLRASSYINGKVYRLAPVLQARRRHRRAKERSFCTKVQIG